MSTQSIPAPETQSLECVTTDFLHALCAWCGEAFEPKRKDQVNCSRACNNASHNAKTQEKRAVGVKQRKAEQHERRRRNNRGFLVNDGPMESGQSDHTVEKRKRDGGYHPMPIAVHVERVKTKLELGHTPSPEDHTWSRSGTGQRRFTAYRVKKNFCPQCSEYVNENHEHRAQQ